MLDLLGHCQAGCEPGDALRLPSPSSRTVLGPLAAAIRGFQVMRCPQRLIQSISATFMGPGEPSHAWAVACVILAGFIGKLSWCRSALPSLAAIAGGQSHSEGLSFCYSVEMPAGSMHGLAYTISRLQPCSLVLVR